MTAHLPAPVPSRPSREATSVGLLADLVGSYGRGIATGVGAYAHLVGWRLVTPPIWGFVDRMPEFSKWSVDGMIVMIHDEPLLERMRSMGVPVVNVSSGLPEYPFPSVITDNRAIGRLAAEHLRGIGLRRFACFDAGPQWAHDRCAAFREAVEQHGLPVAKLQAWGESDASAPSLRRRRWLASLTPPTGIFATNDSWARMILLDCHDVQWRVPEDLAVIGVDDDPLVARLSKPPLSSVLTNAEQIGYRAARQLDALLQGEPAPAEPICIEPAGVTARLSTQVAAVDDPLLASVVRFIREHGHRPLNVADVLAFVPLSRRPLEKRFRAALGRSILDEIHRVKVERAQRLLQETDMTIAAIASACGYSNASRFGVMFRKRTGESPGHYRARSRIRG